MSYTVEFGDTEFSVPIRYLDLAPKGVGAQGMVWWVKEEDLYTTALDKEWKETHVVIIWMPYDES